MKEIKIKAQNISVQSYPKKKYLYGNKKVVFFFEDETIPNVNSYFLQPGISFEVTEEVTGILHATNPFFDKEPLGVVMVFMWVFHFEKNLWMKECPLDIMKTIYKSTEEERLDKRLLRGFSYSGNFDAVKRSNLTGRQVSKLCQILGVNATSDVVRAADLLNHQFNGHRNTSDTAVSNSSYKEDSDAYDLLVSMSLLHLSVSIQDNLVFLRLPEIKSADENLKISFLEVNNRFEYIDNDSYEREPLLENLCEEQLSSVDTSMKNGVSYITGSAGRGKSSTIMEIIRRSAKTMICTPTHAARKVVARRMKMSGVSEFCSVDVIAYIQIHAKKYSEGERCSNSPRYAREEYLFGKMKDLETLVVEEASMVDIVSISKLIRSMVDAFPSMIRIVFVGDTNQLRSIGKGNILDDLITSKSIPGTILSINHRSGALSKNIDCILNGNMEDIVEEKGKFEVLYVDEVSTDTDEDGTTRHVAPTVVSEMVRVYAQMGHQTHSICYTHKELDLVNEGFHNIHGKLLDLTPGLKIRVKSPSLVLGSTVYGNDLLVLESSSIRKGVIHLELREWSRTKQSPSDDTFSAHVVKNKLNQAFSVGYSTTCHSFQGDEADAIVIHAVQNCKYFDRMALYTAASRARELIVLVTIRGRGNWGQIMSRVNDERVSCLSYVLDDDILS